MHFITPNLFRSSVDKFFFYKMYVRIALACWGSALLNDLFNALISYSRVAEAPPSKKPDCYKIKNVLFPLAI